MEFWQAISVRTLRGKTCASESWLVFGVLLLIGWQSGASFFSQSHGVEMQNQTRSCLSCFRIVSSFILEGKGLRTTASSPEPLWSMERMQAYFCYVKTIKPQLTPESTRWVDCASDMTQTIFSIYTFNDYSSTHGVSNFVTFTHRVSSFITSILKSLVILAMWLVLSGAIYFQIALSFALNRIFFLSQWEWHKNKTTNQISRLF